MGKKTKTIVKKANAKPKRVAKNSSAKPKPRGKKSLKGFKAVEGEVVEHDSLSNENRERDSKGSDSFELDLFDSDSEDQTPPKIKPSADEKGLAQADPIARYLSEIGRYPLLTREQEQALAIRYRETGDSDAAEKLVTSNLRFVVKVASEYSKFGARLIDLVQEGNVGLMHAVKEFNPYKGVRLITYAVWWIKGYIQEYLMRQHSMVRIGTTANQRKLFYQLQKERQKLERLGLEHGIAQLSGRLGVSPEEVDEMQMRMSGRDISLDAPIGDDSTGRRIDAQSDVSEGDLDEVLGHQEQLKLLVNSIEDLRTELNERELFILDARLLSDEPMTLQEIGDKYGTTREAVRQMEVRVMNKIKKAFTQSEGLSD